MAGREANRRSLIPQQVKWEKAGDQVEGTLLSKEMTTYKDQQRGRYLIQQPDGLKVVLGTFQIDQAMTLVPVGALVHIEMVGEEGTNTGNRFKLFDIWVDDGEAEPKPETAPPSPDPVQPKK